MIPVIYENIPEKYLDESLKNEEEEFILLFKNAVGKPNPLQKFWIRRVLNKESFSLVSPKGVGKTTFGLITSLFFLLKNKKSHIVVPTTILASQCAEDLIKFSKIIGIELGLNGNGHEKEKMILYYGGLKEKEKKRLKELIKNNQFDVLITTTQFLVKNFDLI